MGKLNYIKLRKLTLNWVIPVLIALALIFLLNGRISANPEPTRAELQGYINDNKLSVGSESTDGYQQIYYMHDNEKVYITDGQRNHTKPMISGQNVVWEEVVDGFSQIVTYDLLDKTRLQITQSGTNLSPSISGNKVVWEGVVEGVNQIFYFDGFETQQLSSGAIALRPSIKDNVVIYAEYVGGETNSWRVLSKDITTSDPPIIVVQGDETISWPKFVGENIKTTL